ncbi:MAG: hypothetical protein R3A10_21280 [Caldilineaceae bacterium]
MPTPAAGLDLDLVLESSPVDLEHGDPGLGVTRGARPRRLRGAGQQGTAGAGLPRTARPGP